MNEIYDVDSHGKVEGKKKKRAKLQWKLCLQIKAEKLKYKIEN